MASAPSSPSLPDRLRAAKAASRTLAAAPAAVRTQVLRGMAAALADPEQRARLLAANAQDVTEAEAALSRGELSEPLVRRLVLTTAKLDVLVDGLEQLAGQTDDVGAQTLHRELDEGLRLRRVVCPLGVLGVVFEARPDAVPQIVGLAMRTGNAVALKGGREATRSNIAMVAVLREVLVGLGLDPAVLVLLEGRADVTALLSQSASVDLIIARGSKRFVEYVQANSKIPVMGHAEGLCHIVLDAAAAPEMSAALVHDAKTSYPAACNAVETLLWLPGAEAALSACVQTLREAGVELLGCPKTCGLHPGIAAASDADWDTEYGDLRLSIRALDDLGGALEHIERHGSGHTECIVTADPDAAERFVSSLDAACVFHNASTRFADGYRFGLGAEVGISTQKLHARGPVGAGGLLTYRWELRGEGHTASAYGSGGRMFTHRDLDDPDA